MKDIRIRFDLYNLFEVFLAILLIYALWQVGNFLLVLGVALLISTFIEDFVQIFKKYKIPRLASVIGFYIMASVIFTLLVIFVIPVFAKEISSLVTIYPEIQNMFPAQSAFFQSGESVSFSNVIEQLQNEETRKIIFSTILSFFGGILNLLVIFIVSFYLSLQKGIVAQLLQTFVPTRYEERTLRVWERVQKKIGSWFRGQLIMSLILVVLTYAGLALAGVPYAFLLSCLAGLFGLIPYGIYVAGAVAVLVGIGYAGPWMGLGVAVFYFILQQILDLILQPIIVRKLTGIPSLLVIVSVFGGAHLFGLYGVLLAIPMALIAVEILNEIKFSKNYPEKNIDSLTL